MASPSDVALFLAVGGFGVFVNLGAAAARSAVGETAASVVGAAAGVLSNRAARVLTPRPRRRRWWAWLFGEFCASSAVAVGVRRPPPLLRFRAPGGAAQLCGILCGTAINFAAQNWVVFARAGRGATRN